MAQDKKTKAISVTIFGAKCTFEAIAIHKINQLNNLCSTKKLNDANSETENSPEEPHTSLRTPLLKKTSDGRYDVMQPAELWMAELRTKNCQYIWCYVIQETNEEKILLLREIAYNWEAVNCAMKPKDFVKEIFTSKVLFDAMEKLFTDSDENLTDTLIYSFISSRVASKRTLSRNKPETKVKKRSKTDRQTLQKSNDVSFYSAQSVYEEFFPARSREAEK